MTDTPAHTPGSWTGEVGNDGTFAIYGRSRANGTQLLGEFYPEDTGRFARLIATAPVLVEALREAIDAIEDDRGLDDYICCSGYMCGCQGSSKRQLMLHDLRAALSQAGGAGE